MPSRTSLSESTSNVSKSSVMDLRIITAVLEKPHCGKSLLPFINSMILRAATRSACTVSSREQWQQISARRCNGQHPAVQCKFMAPHLLSAIMVSMRSSVLSCMRAAATRGCAQAANGDTTNAEHSDGSSSSSVEAFMGSVLWLQSLWRVGSTHTHGGRGDLAGCLLV